MALMKSITILIVHVSVLVISFISLSECNEKSITNTTTTTGLTIDLNHLVFTLTSPHYNPSLSHSQRVADALSRSSFNRRVAADAASMASSNQHNQATADITNPNGLFYLQYYIGNPRVSISGILGMASDLIWTSCNSSVKSIPIPCGTSQCNLYPERTCSGRNTNCTYSTRFASGSTIQGTLSTGTIAFAPAGGPQIQNAIFGCGTDSDSTLGIVGLGGGKISLVRQFGSLQFGFCLAPFEKTSKLHLGDNAVAAGGVEVPLTPTEENKPTFYRVSVVAIIVGKQTLNLGGNMLIDTGTTKTMFREPFYSKFFEAVKASIPRNFKMVTVPSGLDSDLCYSNLPSNFNATAVFENKAHLTWKLENLFLQFEDNLWCLAAGISTVEDSIYGSTALTNFAVGLDLKANTVTFLPTACAGK